MIIIFFKVINSLVLVVTALVSGSVGVTRSPNSIGSEFQEHTRQLSVHLLAGRERKHIPWH